MKVEEVSIVDTLKERKDEVDEEGTSPVKPISYAMLPSALNNPKFLSDIGPGFKFSLNKAKTYLHHFFWPIRGPFLL